MVDATKRKIKSSCHQALPADDFHQTKNAIKRRYLMVTSRLGAYPHPAPLPALHRQKNESCRKEVN